MRERKKNICVTVILFVFQLNSTNRFFSNRSIPSFQSAQRFGPFLRAEIQSKRIICKYSTISKTRWHVLISSNYSLLYSSPSSSQLQKVRFYQFEWYRRLFIIVLDYASFDFQRRWKRNIFTKISFQHFNAHHEYWRWRFGTSRRFSRLGELKITILPYKINHQ